MSSAAAKAIQAEHPHTFTRDREPPPLFSRWVTTHLCRNDRLTLEGLITTRLQLSSEALTTYTWAENDSITTLVITPFSGSYTCNLPC